MRIVTALATAIFAWHAGLPAAAQALHDPTRPADYYSGPVRQAQVSDGSQPSWTVSAIRLSASGKSAIVNGRFVRVGDVIGNARVADIRADIVLLEIDRRQVDVPLLGISVKQPAAARGDRS